MARKSKNIKLKETLELNEQQADRANAPVMLLAADAPLSTKFDNQITTPFAANGLKQSFPDEPAGDGLINQSEGFTLKYRTPINAGGAYIKMENFNEIINKTQLAIKEVQDKAVTSVNGDFPDENGNVRIDVGVKTVNNETPDENGNINISVGEGTVKKVNEQLPDATGSVYVDVGLKSVNGQYPYLVDKAFEEIVFFPGQANWWVIGTYKGALFNAGAGKIQRSINGGDTWATVYEDATLTFQKIMAISNKIFVLHETGMLASDDGITWQPTALVRQRTDTIFGLSSITEALIDGTTVYNMLITEQMANAEELITILHSSQDNGVTWNIRQPLQALAAAVLTYYNKSGDLIEIAGGLDTSTGGVENTLWYYVNTSELTKVVLGPDFGTPQYMSRPFTNSDDFLLFTDLSTYISKGGLPYNWNYWGTNSAGEKLKKVRASAVDPRNGNIYLVMFTDVNRVLIYSQEGVLLQDKKTNIGNTYDLVISDYKAAPALFAGSDTIQRAKQSSNVDLDLSVNLPKIQTLPTQFQNYTRYNDGPPDVGCLYRLTNGDILTGSAVNDGIRISRDDGVTFNHTNYTHGAFNTFIELANGYVIAVGDGILRSANMGLTWEPMSSGVRRKGLLQAKNGTIFTSGWDNADGVFKSYDSGATWASVNAGLPVQKAIFYRTSTGRIIMGTSAIMRYSDDNGETWTPYVSQIGQWFDVVQPVYNEGTPPSILLACTGGKGMYYSQNNGTTWQRLAISGQYPDTTFYYFIKIDNKGTIAACSSGGISVESMDTASGLNLFLRSTSLTNPTHGAYKVISGVYLSSGDYLATAEVSTGGYIMLKMLSNVVYIKNAATSNTEYITFSGAFDVGYGYPSRSVIITLPYKALSIRGMYCILGNESVTGVTSNVPFITRATSNSAYTTDFAIYDIGRPGTFNILIGFLADKE